MTDLWFAARLSLCIATSATLLASAVAVPLSFILARKAFRGRSLIDSLLLLPLVLPPTVVGYLIILLFGARGLIGQWLNQWFGYSILFRIEGAILAAAIVALPLIYLPSRAGFGSIDREMTDIALLMGATPLQSFWHVALPLARNNILCGMLLGFARALGEFGATMMVFGWQSDRLTLPISIYSDYEQGRFANAWAAVLLLSIFSLALTIAFNAWSSSNFAFARASGLKDE